MVKRLLSYERVAVFAEFKSEEKQLADLSNLDVNTKSLPFQASWPIALPNTTRPFQVFWGGDAGNQGDGIRSAWAQQFPDIPLNLTITLSKYADTRLDEAFYEGVEVPADVVALQTLHDFPRWKSQNRLLFYKPANWEDLLVDERDADGAFLAFAICELFDGLVDDCFGADFCG